MRAKVRLAASPVGPERWHRAVPGAAFAAGLVILSACTTGDVFALKPAVDVGTSTGSPPAEDAAFAILPPAQPAAVAPAPGAAQPKPLNIVQKHPTLTGIAAGVATHAALKRSAAIKEANGQKLNFAEKHPTLTGIAAGVTTHHIIKKMTPKVHS